MRHYLKNGRAWLWLLFVLNIAYLIYELAFNSRLVDASVARLTSGDVRALELEGRILSGIGLSLLLLRLITLKNKQTSVFIKQVALAIAIGFPVMFFGQRILVDVLIDRTSAEQRMDAQHLLLMKRGLATNSLQLEGIAFDEEDLDSPHTRSFLSVLGLMTFVSPAFVDDLKAEAERIIHQVATNEASKELPESYQAYETLQASIGNAWDGYKTISDNYWSAQQEISTYAEQAWLDMQEDLLSQWQDNQVEGSEEAFTRQVLTLQRSLTTYFNARQRCEDGRFRNECIVRVEEIYREEVVDNLGHYVAPTDWCYAQEVVTQNVRRGNRFVTEQRTVQRCENLAYDHLNEKLATVLGVPASYEHFVASDTAAAQVRQAMLAQNVELPSAWRANDREGFFEAVIAKQSHEAGEQAAQAMQKHLGASLPLDLTADAFIASQPIQDQLHEALQPRDEQMIITLDLTPEQFRDQLLLPHYLAYAEAERQRLYDDAQLLANGQPREEEGKQYVRALIVPPIAMGFSLFFALVNAIGLAASVPVLMGSKRRWLPHVIKVGGLVVVVTIPMLSSVAVTQTPTYRYFNEEFQRSMTTGGALFATWVIHTQPVIYSIGRFATYIAPPLVSGDSNAIERPRGVDQETLVVAEQASGETLAEPADSPPSPLEIQENVNQGALPDDGRPLSVVHLDVSTPLENQLTTLLNNTPHHAVLIDVQQLSDGNWAIHRSPVITGEGTCLTNFSRAMDISRVNSLQWRAARHGDCGSDAIAKRPVSIPLAADFARVIQRNEDGLALWVHFQPTLLGEVNCHAVRREADHIADVLGASRFTAAASTPQVLSCFARHERQYGLAYFGPEHGEPQAEGDSQLRRMNLAEVQRLRERARGVGYRPQALSLSGAALEGIQGVLANGDWLVVHLSHTSTDVSTFSQTHDLRYGVFGARQLPASSAGQTLDVIVTRNHE
ncbi:MAG: hypothetical protein ACQEUK_02980 [Pseudomonadota bacterium]